jgi:OPA family glycerol-3-phosphate transporter-like MFS transporter
MHADIPLIASLTLVAMPIVAFLSSYVSGLVSDKIFRGQRGPVAMVLDFTEGFTVLAAAMILHFGFVEPGTLGVLIGCGILIMISLTVNATHSLVGAAAPMDIGGKKMAGFASGVIDSFQYFGGALSFLITGQVLKMTQESYGYTFWYVTMACFSFSGAVFMLLLVRKQKRMAVSLKP